ncbi:M-phase-specific PLK1-interacting protein-like [Huso huso]|uniref:M-phase-specific PLK1-interacting protein-like n=1 Tax=Huso huso TaxID=61971 RepID=A0ABR0ZZY9_HUSHU
MYRPGFRHPLPPGNGGMDQRPAGFRGSPTGPGFGGGGQAGLLPPPNRGFLNATSPPYGQRPWQYSGKSPHTPPKNFYGNNNNGSGGMGSYNSPSPGQTAQRPSPRYSTPYANSPGGYNDYHYHHHHHHHHYQKHSPGQQRGYRQGSPRTSTPFGSAHGREKRVSNDVENYYRPSMLEDPWASLEPVTVTDTNQKYNREQTTNTAKRGRYFS